VEARERVGGRVWSVGGVDLGAHSIHGTEGNPITTFARERNLPTLYVGGDTTYTGGWAPLVVFDPRGRTFTPEEKHEGLLLVDEVRDAVDALRRQIAAAGGKDISFATAVARVLEGRELSTAQRAALDWHLTLLSRDDWAA